MSNISEESHLPVVTGVAEILVAGLGLLLGVASRCAFDGGVAREP